MKGKLMPVLANCVVLLLVLGLSVIITQTASATEIEQQIASITIVEAGVPIINADVNGNIAPISKQIDGVAINVDTRIDRADLSSIETRNLHIISLAHVDVPRAIID